MRVVGFKFDRLLLFFVGVLVVVSFVFSNSYLNYKGDMTYFINSEQPRIKYEITSSLEQVFLHSAYLFLVNSTNLSLLERFSNYDGEVVDQAESVDYVFVVSDVLKHSEKYKFFFNITDELGKSKSFLGDRPSFFFLNLDTSKPNITNFESGEVINLIGKNKDEVVFLTNKKIKKFSIVGQEVGDDDNIFFVVSESSYENQVNFADFNNFFSFSTIDNSIADGVYRVQVSIEDLHGNVNRYVFTLNKNEEVLRVFPVSRKEDSSLKYFFDRSFPEYEEFFNGTLYVDSKPFDFKVTTNKRAECFFSNKLISFSQEDFVQNFLTFKRLSGVDFLISDFDFVGEETKFEVYCKNGASEKSYLNDFFNLPSSLLTFKFYDEDLQIVDYSPRSSILSTDSFDFILKTNIRAYCAGSFDGSGVFYFVPDDEFLEHEFSFKDLQAGDHKLNVSCFSLSGEEEKLSLSFKVESFVSEIVEEYSPRFTSSSLTDVNLVLREDSDCRYSMSPVDISSSFDDLPSVEKLIGLEREFSVSLKSEGENKVFLYCKKSDGVTVLNSTIFIYYDKSGVEADEIFFVNEVEGERVKSKYTSSSREFVVDYSFNSSLDIKRYNITLFNEKDSNVVKEFSSRDRYSVDVKENVSKVSVVGINKAGSSDEVSLNVLLDLESPRVSLNVDRFDNLQISCQDSKSGCYKIFYGFSTTVDQNCFRKILYNSNVNLKQDYVFLCGVAYDKVGNAFFFNKTIRDWSYGENVSNQSVSIGDENSSLTQNLSSVDTDLDGIPDWWENKFYLNFEDSSDALEDNDNDGFTNLEEFRRGTDPNVPDVSVEGNQTGSDSLDPFMPSPPVSQKSNNLKIFLLIFFIIFLLIIVVVFYLYQRGFLDKYLDRFRGESVDFKQSRRSEVVRGNSNLSDGGGEVGDGRVKKGDVKSDFRDEVDEISQRSSVSKAREYVEKKNSEIDSLLKGFDRQDDMIRESVRNSLKSKGASKVDDLKDFEGDFKRSDKVESFDFEDEANKFEKYYKERVVNSKKSKKVKKKL